jgi:hypothetical protein
MANLTKRIAFLSLAALLCTALTASADKKFSSSDDAKEKDDEQTFLKDYDKLVKGSEADWVYFAPGADLKSFKKVALPAWSTSGGKPSKAKAAAESGPGYAEEWIKQSKKLGWQVVPDGGDLTIEGNICNAWEPSGGARFWGGWMANPGSIIELVGKDKSGKTVFEIRHKAKGSTIEDAVENGLKKIIETLEAGK